MCSDSQELLRKLTSYEIKTIKTHGVDVYFDVERTLTSMQDIKREQRE